MSDVAQDLSWMTLITEDLHIEQDGYELSNVEVDAFEGYLTFYSDCGTWIRSEYNCERFRSDYLASVLY